MILTCPVCKTQYEKGMVHACNNTFIDDAPRIRLERDALLVERQKTHGSFANNAHTYNRLKSCLTSTGLSDTHTLAIDMICLKLSRLIQNPNVKDHWDDIAGYAKLGAEACEEPSTVFKDCTFK